MGYKLERSNSGVEYEKVPAGNHRCCIVAVTELGTHTEEAFKKGAPDVTRFKIQIVYELLDEERAEPAGPYVIGHVYTASDFEDAPIMKAWVAAMGRAKKKDEIPDMESIVGKVVMVEVVHQAGKTDPSKIYDKVKGVTPLPVVMKRMPVKPQYQPCYHALGTYRQHDWHPRIFGTKVADFIAACQEAKDGKLSAPDEEDDPFAGVNPGGRRPGSDDDIVG